MNKQQEIEQEKCRLVAELLYSMDYSSEDILAAFDIRYKVACIDLGYDINTMTKELIEAKLEMDRRLIECDK